MTLTPPPHNFIGHRGARHSPHQASEGPEGQCPSSKQKPPLTRGLLCPRWDSNCIPALANAGNSRKHTESGPVRPGTAQSEGEGVHIVHSPSLIDSIESDTRGSHHNRVTFENFISRAPPLIICEATLEFQHDRPLV
jgi:hypothetical protein